MLFITTILCMPLFIFYLYYKLTVTNKNIIVNIKIKKNKNGNTIYQILSAEEVFVINKELWEKLIIGKTYSVAYYGLNYDELNLQKKIYRVKI